MWIVRFIKFMWMFHLNLQRIQQNTYVCASMKIWRENQNMDGWLLDGNESSILAMMSACRFVFLAHLIDFGVEDYDIFLHQLFPLEQGSHGSGQQADLRLQLRHILYKNDFMISTHILLIFCTYGLVEQTPVQAFILSIRAISDPVTQLIVCWKNSSRKCIWSFEMNQFWPSLS